MQNGGVEKWTCHLRCDQARTKLPANRRPVEGVVHLRGRCDANERGGSRCDQGANLQVSVLRGEQVQLLRLGASTRGRSAATPQTHAQLGTICHPPFGWQRGERAAAEFSSRHRAPSERVRTSVVSPLSFSTALITCSMGVMLRAGTPGMSQRRMQQTRHALRTLSRQQSCPPACTVEASRRRPGNINVSARDEAQQGGTDLPAREAA